MYNFFLKILLFCLKQAEEFNRAIVDKINLDNAIRKRMSKKAKGLKVIFDQKI